jgi:hypothetical protein
MMDKIGHLINKRLNQHKLGESAQASAILHFVNQELIGKLKADPNEMRALTLEKGVLWVGISHSAWGQELRGIQSHLLREIEKEYGAKKVLKIRTKGLTSQ